jgi:hypothetical protein
VSSVCCLHFLFLSYVSSSFCCISSNWHCALTRVLLLFICSECKRMREP